MFRFPQLNMLVGFIIHLLEFRISDEVIYIQYNERAIARVVI